MKLVTFGEGAGRVGVLEGDEIAVLDVPTMREYFERGGADETGERVALAETRLRAPIIPKKFFHTAGNFREHKTESENVNWSHDIAPWINFFQNVDAIIGPDEPVIYPEHLTEELDYELELAVVLKKAGKWFSRRGGDGLHRRLRDLQRPHGAGHPARRDALGRVLVLQGDRHVLPARALDRDARRDSRSARPARWSCASTARCGRSRTRGTCPSRSREILSNFSGLGYSAGDVLSTGTVSGVAGFKSPEERALLYLKPGDVIEAEIERIGVLRNPVISWQEGHGTPPLPRVRPWGENT